jgi:hypothetical protein
MKRLIYLSIITVLFSNCRSNNKPSAADSSKTITSTDPASALIKKFGPVINGSWVKADYIEKIRKTKSPLAAADLTDGMTAIEINTDSIKGDSIVGEAGYGNHEGGDAIIKFKPSKTRESILLNDGDLTYNINNGDTTISVQQYLLKNKERTFVKYVKVHPIDHSQLGSATYQLVNEALVAGNYNMTDSVGAISKVGMSADGKITGFNGFATYLVNIDLNTDVMDNLDELILYNKSKDPRPAKEYSYKIIGDTLKLYSMRANADSTKAILDKLQYTLVRVK